jgi:hypothetical protein
LVGSFISALGLLLPLLPLPLPQLDDLDSLNYDDLGAIAKLTADPHYKDVMTVGVTTHYIIVRCIALHCISPSCIALHCVVWVELQS